MSAPARVDTSITRPLAAGALASLKRLPRRRPADPPAPSSAAQWRAVTEDRYEVAVHGEVVGFIEVVGAVYVALAGQRYDRAMETTQTLVFDEAVSALTN